MRARHRKPKGPEVIRHRQVMEPAERWSIVVALLIIAAVLGTIGYFMLTIPTGGVTTP